MKKLVFVASAILFTAVLTSCSCEKCVECINEKTQVSERKCEKDHNILSDWQNQRLQSSSNVRCNKVDDANE